MNQLRQIRIRAVAVIIMMTLCGCAITDQDDGGTPDTSKEPEAIRLQSDVASAEETDDSRIQALPRYEAGHAVRYYVEPVNDFIPSEEYGTVYPYIGERNKVDEWTDEVYGYGFVDGQGQIICDPVYTDVIRITFGEQSAYVATAKYCENGNYFKEDSIKGFVAVIGADGSFYQKYDDVSMASGIAGGNIINNRSEYEYGYEHIAVKKGERWGAIGFDGAAVLPFEYINAPLFSEGLAAVFMTNEEYLVALEAYDGFYINMQDKFYQLQIPYVYVNVYGETVLGPYPCPPLSETARMIGDMVEGDGQALGTVAFRNDRAMNFTGMYYGFINKTGETVIPHEYVLMEESQSRWNEYGNALVCQVDVEEIEGYSSWPLYQFSHNGVPDQALYALIDSNGNKLCEYIGSVMGANYEGDGFYTVYDYSEDSMKKLVGVFDLQGNDCPVPAAGDGYLGNGWFWSGWTEEADGELYLRGYGIERMLQGSTLAHLAGDWFVVMDEDWDSIRVINAQTGADSALDEVIGWFSVRASAGKRSIIYGDYEDNPEGEQVYGVMDSDTAEFLVDFQYDYLSLFGDYYLAVQDNYGGLLDQDGNWLIKTPLYGNYD